MHRGVMNMNYCCKYVVWLVLIVIVLPSSYITGEKFADVDLIHNHSDFFNFGTKSSKIDKDKYQNAIVKSKVDVLGVVFKQMIDGIKKRSILDLVFLIDASSSVGEHNFQSELKFVKKLLSDVTVDFNHTRIALITFSSETSVITNVDEISNPSEVNNKCLLVTRQMNEIIYTGGGTYTLGAFTSARDIFAQSRNDTRKVLFLITDGFSNGGNPVPIADELKAQAVTIFTIGISNGNYKELYDLSSEPGELHSYLLDSFEEFESLARKALHVDLHSGEYIPLGLNHLCDHLCPDGANCCDRNALCTCGTSTGHYTCLCRPGYYGSGLKNSCLPCPSGSYSDGPNLCLPCPDIQHYTTPPANGLESCRCKDGYKATENNTCEVIKCPKLLAPENGYFVKRKDCSNVLNSACGVRCNVGYTLIGSSIRLCQANGTWSGLTPSCQVKTCSKLHVPQHGTMQCKHTDLGADFTNELHLPVDTMCSFECERGRTLVGSKQRTCLPLAQWDGLRAACKQIKCNKLSKINFGSVEPKSCTFGKQPFGKRCNFTCNEGFVLSGPTHKVCSGEHGTWDTNDEIQCKDVTKPKITCPKDVYGEALKGKPFGIANWSLPNAIDNSGLNVTIWTKPSIKSSKFKIGTTNVTYFAQDSFNNRAKCSFAVTILDNEPPTIEECVDPVPFLIQSNASVNITWDEPNIFDNSQRLQINKSHEFGKFPVGTTQVTYIAIDQSNNTNTCILNITLQESKCDFLPDPSFGHADCQPFNDSIQCVVTCEEGYALPWSVNSINSEEDNATTFICQHSQPMWFNQHGGVFPECSVNEIPLEINQTGHILLENDDVCANQSRAVELENEIKLSLLNESCADFDCTVKLQAKCKDVEGKEERTNRIQRDVATTNDKKRKGGKRKRVQLKIQMRPKNTKMAKASSNKTKIIKNVNVRGHNVELDNPKIACPPGSFNRKYKCVRCPEGTYHNVTTNSCQSCEIGYYNNKPGQVTCTLCPRNHSTRRLHCKSPTDCIEQCPPGTFAHRKRIKRPPKNNPNFTGERVTLKPYCSSCPLGQYQSDFGATQCKVCAGNLTTNRRGAIDGGECVIDAMNICVDKNPCVHGRCHIENDFYYSCECNPSFIGVHCDIKIDPCDSNPCQNNGRCTSFANNFTCTCPDGYQGPTCSQIANSCDLNCTHNGTCVFVDDDDEKLCLCYKGYEGVLCENLIKYCKENLCENGGRCEEAVDGFKCSCRGGFMGKRCTYLPCDYQPCPDNALCFNVENSTNYRCECVDGFTGHQCSEKINYCKENPCMNGGNCTSLGTHYECACLKNFIGTNCEIELIDDYILHFPRASVTDYVGMDGFTNNLTQISVCFWLMTNDSFNYGTILSYATKQYDNAFTITDYTGMVIYINNNYVVTDILLNDNTWHHICFCWKNADGEYAVYLDGGVASIGKNFALGAIISGRGKLILGQEQDSLEGRFSQSESFIGRITYLDIYSVYLSQDDVSDIMNLCTHQHFGDLFAWPEFALEIKGDVEVEQTTFCKQCAPPEKLHNGIVEVINNTAVYQCNDGYVLNIYGGGRRCLKASRWEGNAKPYCKIINCGYPGYIHNGFVLGKSYSYLDVVRYECNYGYNLTGSAERTCNKNGDWEPEQPRCVGIECAALELTALMEISITNEDLDASSELFGGYHIGTQVTVACKQGNLEGNTTLICLENGSWDVNLPKCIIPKPMLPCSLEHIPKPPANGYMDPESYERVLEGMSNIIEYRCNKTYNLVGFNSSTCIIDGYWSELKMSCHKSLCTSPPKFPSMVLTEASLNNPSLSFIGSLATYECKEGFRSFKVPRIQCKEPGVWTRMHSICTKISCGKPPVASGTKIIGRSFLFNDKVKLMCDAGAMEIKCASNGSWMVLNENVCEFN